MRDATRIAADVRGGGPTRVARALRAYRRVGRKQSRPALEAEIDDRAQFRLGEVRHRGVAPAPSRRPSGTRTVSPLPRSGARPCPGTIFGTANVRSAPWRSPHLATPR